MQRNTSLMTVGLCLGLAFSGLQTGNWANLLAEEELMHFAPDEEAVLTDVLVNGDFEDGATGWSVPDSAVIDRETFKTGNSSLRITRKGDGDETFPWDLAGQNVAIAGGAYRLSIWIKLENAAHTHVKVIAADKNDQLIGDPRYLSIGRSGTVDWFEGSGVLNLPEEATRVNWTLYGGTGTSWFDAAKMEMLPRGKSITPQAEWLQATRAKYGEDMIAAPMKERIIYYDRRYDYHRTTPDLLTFFTRRGFTTLDADQLRDWMQAKIRDGADGTVCVMGCYVPDTITESKDALCTLRRYLEAGGRVAWVGDVPLFYRSFRDRAFEIYGGAGRVLGMKSGAWGESLTITPEGEQWGMQIVDTVAKERPFLSDTASVVFSEVPGTTSVGAFFTNYNPDFPYSGFMRYGHGHDGGNAGLNADLYRLSLYRGEPIEVPLVTAETEAEKAAAWITVGTPLNNYPRGYIIPVTVKADEGVTADRIRLAVTDGKRVVKETEARFGEETVFRLETKALASREYKLTVKLITDNQVTDQVESEVCLVPRKTDKFPIGVFGVNVPDSEYKSDMILNDLKEHLGECGVAEGSGYFGDEALKYGLRLMGVCQNYYANALLPAASPELLVRVATGELPKYNYSGTGPAPVCMGNPINRQRINETVRADVKRRIQYPASIKRMFVSDDGGLFGDQAEGLLACYCGYCTTEFKKLTGFDAPLARPAQAAETKGVISDNDPWYLWNKFRSKNTYGNWNRSMKEAKDEIDPEVKFGPIPGGGSAPVFNPQWALNPPDNYGGIGMASYYAYPFYNSCFVFLTQSALAMMGNRENELWVIPQGWNAYNLMTPPDVRQLVRNEFYYLLAAGAKGMIYWLYSEMTGTPAWEEFKNLSRIGTRFGPLLLTLKQPSAKVGILASYCNASYGGGGNGRLYSAFSEAHIPVDFVADEEILAGRLKDYQVLVLGSVDYLTQSVYDRITEFVNAGATVVTDGSGKIDIPGAETLADDRQMIARSREIVDPWFEVDTPDLIVTQFTGNDARYLMVVNNQRLDTTEGTITLKGLKGHQPYDVFAGQAIKPDSEGRFALAVEPAGGKLIGVHAAAVENISLQMPAKISAGKESSLKIEITGKDGTTLKSLLPVQVKINDPEGSETEYSDYYAAEDGELNISLVPAVNDIPGEWELEIRELSSGISRKSSFAVE